MQGKWSVSLTRSKVKTLANHKREWPLPPLNQTFRFCLRGGGCTQASYLARLQPQSGPAHNYARNSTTGTVHAESSYPGWIREKPRNEHVIANFVGTLMGEGFFHYTHTHQTGCELDWRAISVFRICNWNMKNEVCSAEKLAWENSRDGGGSEARHCVRRLPWNRRKSFGFAVIASNTRLFGVVWLKGQLYPQPGPPSLRPAGIWRNRNRFRISSVGRALDCRARGRGFDSQDRT